MEYRILNKVTSPEILRRMTNEQLNTLCGEIRECIIDTVSNNGGHLASNLGAVELTIALHRVFQSPRDAILFDVGHQSYTHKLLTGRFDRFDTLRREGGISGFMDPEESEYDAYVSGHSSNSVSFAYGIYKAKAISGQEGTAVAVIGDGAMTGGMAFEAINNIGADKAKFLLVLNDNEMSISQNVGSLARHLNKIRSKSSYHSFKDKLSRFLNKIPLIGKWLYRVLFRSKTVLKNAIYHSNVFEGLGLNYFGPVDGHDIKAIENILTIAKNQDRPAIVHVVTVKGKGYSFAESDPGRYHGISHFDKEKGCNAAVKVDYSSVAGSTLCELAQKDSKICAVTAAMTSGTGLCEFAEKFPQRFFDVGIAEEHAMTFTSGLASGGLKPYFAVYSSFLQRAYDQIIHDAAIAGLPVRILVDRAGLVGEDGKTHHGLFDVSFLSSVPGMTVYSPASFDELKKTIENTAEISSPVAIRYPRGNEEGNKFFSYTGKDFDVFLSGSSTALVTYGRLSFDALSAAKESGATLIKLNKIYPLQQELISLLLDFDKVCIFEEGIKSGGVGEKLLASLSENGFKGKATLNAVDNRFVKAAGTASQLSTLGFDKKAMLGVIS